VKALNNAILISEYNIQNWDIPMGYLCPPIPGRADYIHYIADLLADSNDGIIPKGEAVTGLDVGIGANCIYPIIGNAAYDWSFVGCDIDENALQNCKKIIANNPKLIDAISLQLQTEPRFIFKNIILPEDKFAFTICNPPFHNSAEDAHKAALRKVNNLSKSKTDKTILNFGGKQHELWCAGGEFAFITQMIYESVKYPLQVFWFTTLVSKKDNLKSIYRLLNKVGAVEIKTIDMAQGQKISRMVAWTFLSEDQQKNWKFSE
jgi:23S rRNA (adenine1618-N6)-methyltransferase